jgi:hemolysin activation/secretion protein
VAQLDLLLKTITDHYLGKGLVTSRAYLPQRDLSSGALQVLVVEGALSVFVAPRTVGCPNANWP